MDQVFCSIFWLEEQKLDSNEINDEGVRLRCEEYKEDKKGW